ncbi:putative RNA recognition motif domain, nucleotide-binding alpha-beta plait domain superfamily [Helianthus annuus]|nr:putative RNA recognition motif domain, nucleotide-binding alpha-beta plait domain superfamily [Helianthus annuus]
MEDDGSWKDVPVKKNNRKKGFSGDKINNGNITKFYVTNLPTGCTPWEVSEFVKVFGDVAGVCVARKADKEGRKFGFISFRHVVDVKEMERALNGMKMGGFKLIANIARYAKENTGLFDVNREVMNDNLKEPAKPAKEYKIYNQAYVNQGRGRLFSDLFAKHSTDAGASSSMDVTDGKCIVIPDDTLAFKDLIGKALVGRCKELTVLRKLKDLLAESNIVGVSLSYLGCFFMFLKFDDEESCNSFLLDHPSWGRWFSSLDSWHGQSHPFERLAWVRVQGVPVHLAVNSVVDSIVGRFGKIVHGSQISKEEENLSSNWVGVLVGEGERIHEYVTLCCNKKQFRVWIEEEITDWAPEGMGEVRPAEEIVKPTAEFRSEIRSPVRENEKSEGREDDKSQEREDFGLRVDDNGLGVGNMGVDCVLPNFPNSQEVHVMNCNYNGNTNVSGPILVNNENAFYFKSVDKKKPNKKSVRLRPRNTKPGLKGNTSPISGERPRKRNRETGEFHFDLNVQVEDISTESPPG